MVGLRQTSGLIAALAVLVVSATCTPAACLLPMGRQHAAQQKAKSCCEEPDQPTAPPRVPQDQRCPMCKTSVLIAKNVDHGASFDPAALAFTFFCPTAVGPTIPDAVTVSGYLSNRPPPCPLSLLALHCALLT